ncbi:MAG: glycosyltransferase, partial [Bdellovibrionales bacterium]|nr:glycosyltransferase [Bdellovibrionales bacterium]
MNSSPNLSKEPMGSTDRPMVSICLITYNHENLLDEAFASILGQEVDFKIEVVVGEDCSTDLTREVINKWQKMAPGLIKPIYREFNLGLKQNFVDTLSRCSGEFVALLSGDDYWTDVHKLAKQVGFLADNSEYVLIANNALRFSKSDAGARGYVRPIVSAFDFDTSFLMQSNPCFASQVMFRNNLISKFPPVYYPSVAEDRGLFLLLSRLGKCRFDPEVSGVYRVHDTSITTKRGA